MRLFLISFSIGILITTGCNNSGAQLEQIRQSHAARKTPNWTTSDQAILEELDPPFEIENVSFRPPKGYEATVDLGGEWGSLLWVGEMREDGSRPVIGLEIYDIVGPGEMPSLGYAIRQVKNEQVRGRNTTDGPFHGEIGSWEFARENWEMKISVRQQNTRQVNRTPNGYRSFNFDQFHSIRKRKQIFGGHTSFSVKGLLYATIIGEKVYQINVFDSDKHDDQIKICEAAIGTFQVK